MPGMMDTVLNLGTNDESVKGLESMTDNKRFAWDAYRRFIQMFGNVVMGIEGEKFEKVLEKHKQKNGVELDTELTAENLMEIVQDFKDLYQKETGERFPQDPKVQLWKAINAVFGSWNNPRAIRYRKINEIRGLLGTAVNVQTMVFGNAGGESGTGVCFTRDPSTGQNVFYGEYLMNAQGEDVVAGIRTPETLEDMKKHLPGMYEELVDIRNKLEEHYKDMQDMEFTIEHGKLYMLQTRTGKRTAHVAIKIAVDMVKEGLIDKKIAVKRVAPAQLDQLLHPMIDPKEKVTALAKGLPASPGAAVGEQGGGVLAESG
jgi:pyruvate,orthophosphate dikinase